MHRINFLSSYFLYQNIFLYLTFSFTKISFCIKLFLVPKYLCVSNFFLNHNIFFIKVYLVPKYLLVSNFFLYRNYLYIFSSFFNLYIFSTIAPPLFPKLDSSSIGRGKMMVEFFSAAIPLRVWRYLS